MNKHIRYKAKTQQTGFSVQFSCSIVSDSLRPHGLQYARFPCPSPAPGVCSDSCPLSWWCSLAISASATPFSFCLQLLPASGSFPMSQAFSSDGQSLGASASACPSNEYSGLISFRIDWFDLLAVQGTLKSLLQHHNSKASFFFWPSAFFKEVFPGDMQTGQFRKRKHVLAWRSGLDDLLWSPFWS